MKTPFVHSGPVTVVRKMECLLQVLENRRGEYRESDCSAADMAQLTEHFRRTEVPVNLDVLPSFIPGHFYLVLRISQRITLVSRDYRY
jgi:hypothetical protein